MLNVDDLQFNQILDRLDRITSLFILNLPKEISQQDKIGALSNANMKPKDIAAILGTTPNTVNAALHKIRARESRSKDGEQNKKKESN